MNEYWIRIKRVKTQKFLDELHTIADKYNGVYDVSSLDYWQRRADDYEFYIYCDNDEDFNNLTRELKEKSINYITMQ